MVKRIKIRDKEKTKQKLIDAVGKILRKEGFTGIKVNNIAEVAGVNKKLIYDYFNGLNGLTKAYLEQVDFWNLEKRKNENNPIDRLTKEDVLSLLKRDFEFFDNSLDMQKIILWGLSSKNKTIQMMAHNREKYGEELFKLSDIHFQNSSIDFRALNAIFVSAIYYMVLHAKTMESTICEIDLSEEDGKERILKTIKQLLDWSYETAKDENQSS